MHAASASAHHLHVGMPQYPPHAQNEQIAASHMPPLLFFEGEGVIMDNGEVVARVWVPAYVLRLGIPSGGRSPFWDTYIFQKSKSEMVKMIQNSFLSKEMEVAYIGVLEERFLRLYISTES